MQQGGSVFFFNGGKEEFSRLSRYLKLCNSFGENIAGKKNKITQFAVCFSWCFRRSLLDVIDILFIYKDDIVNVYKETVGLSWAFHQSFSNIRLNFQGSRPQG